MIKFTNKNYCGIIVEVKSNAFYQRETKLLDKGENNIEDDQ